jgi:hypothetical protein
VAKLSLSQKTLILSIGACLVAVTGARGAPVIFASQENVLFRISGITVDVFTLSDDVTALDFDDSGNLWAMGLDQTHQNGAFEVYRIANPFGTPTLQLVSDGVPRQTTSIEWSGGTLYGTQGVTPDPGETLSTIDPLTGALTPVGATGSTGPAASGYPGITIESGTMWGVYPANPGTLATIDWTLGGGPDPTATTVATFATGYNTVTAGLDHDPETGDLWAMLKYSVGGPERIGVFTVDKVTGDITEQYDLSALTGERGASGIALIPEPATLALLALGAMSITRHRRS